MFRKFKTGILILIISVITLLPAYSNTQERICAGKEIRHTAKITFFKNRSGDLIAEIIPTDSEGKSPRFGWTICHVMASNIKNMYSIKTRDVRRVKGYYWVTYRITEKDIQSLLPAYKGELLKIEPWYPPFIK